jgi:hypothetical protein
MGNRTCEIQTVEDKADVRLGLHHLGAGARVQQDPDDPEPYQGGVLMKGQARYRRRLNQHLVRKLQEPLC